MVKFYFAFFASKFHLFILKLLKREKDDKPGLLALKICPNFLEYIKKPKLTIVITGTNGKTTVTNMVGESLNFLNNKVVYNDWGANTPASNARCLLEAVTIFNKTKVDVAIIEMDEISAEKVLPKIQPNYLVVTNLFRDSMHRNAHPEFVFKKINDFIPKNTKLILNADDPISSFLGNNNISTYFGIEKLKNENNISKNIVNDFRICPNCNNEVEIEYIRYHHIGKYHCKNCNFKSKDIDYLGKINNNNLEVIYKNETYNYELINDSIFNAYNMLTVITILKELNYNSEEIKKVLEKIKIVKSRYSSEKVNNIEITTIATKGLNAVATSRVLEYLSNIEGDIAIIIVIDDIFDNKNGSEAISWIYDADFEFLNKENIKQIIIGGVRSLDYKLRLLLGDIKPEIISTVLNEEDTSNEVVIDNIDKIFILHEVYYVSGGMNIKNNIIKRIKRGKK